MAVNVTDEEIAFGMIDDWIYDHAVNEDYRKLDGAMRKIQELVIKDGEKKVIRHFGGYVYCPRCKHDYSHLEDPIDYCTECGQHLDWDDD